MLDQAEGLWPILWPTYGSAPRRRGAIPHGSASEWVIDDLQQSLAEVRRGSHPITWLIEPLARYGAICALELDRDAIVELLPKLMDELAAISDAL